MRADPVERACRGERLGHVQLRALEDALRDPEGDAVDEVALPELERRRRRDVEAGEVGQVAAERLPALGLGLGLRRAPPPEPTVEGRGDEDGRADEAADAERDRDDAVPGRRDRVVRADPAEQRQPAGETEHGCAAEQRGKPDVPEPVPVLHLGVDGGLEGGEALGVPRPVVLDPVAEVREPLGPVGDDRIDDLRDRRLERLHGRLDVAERELEVGDLLRLQAAPDLSLGRHLVGAVAAAPDQVEERRRELERARRASLREQAGTSAGCGSVGGSCSYSRS